MDIEAWKVQKVIENLRGISRIISIEYDDSRYMQGQIWECIELLENPFPAPILEKLEKEMDEIEKKSDTIEAELDRLEEE